MKKFLVLLGLLASLSGPALADSTIDALTAGGAITGTEALPMFQTANPAVSTTPNALDTYLSQTTKALTNKTITCSANTCTVRIANDVSGLGSGVATALAITHDTTGGICTVGGAGCSGGGLTVGTTTITSGTTNRLFFDNAGVLGEAIVGTGLSLSAGTLTATGGGAATGAGVSAGQSPSNIGDNATALPAGHYYYATNVNMTAQRTHPLPDSATQAVGDLEIFDAQQTATSTNQLCAQAAGTDKINAVTNGTACITTAGGSLYLHNDGAGNYTTGAAALIPAPTDAQILLGKTGTPANIITAATLSQDCTITNAAVITCTKTNNVSFGALATTIPGTGVGTWLGTPSSANLAAAITDETGTGLAVFGTSPNLLGTPTLGANGGTVGALKLFGNTSGDATITVPAAAGTATRFQLPATNGANTNVLQTDGSGNTSWVAAGGGGGITCPAGFTNSNNPTGECVLTHNQSNVSAITFTGLVGDNYTLRCNGVLPITDSSFIGIRFSQATVFKTTGYIWATGAMLTTSSSEFLDSSTSETETSLMAVENLNAQAAAGDTTSFVVEFTGLSKAVNHAMNFLGSKFDSTAWYSLRGGGRYTTDTTAIDGIEVVARKTGTDGNITGNCSLTAHAI